MDNIPNITDSGAPAAPSPAAPANTATTSGGAPAAPSPVAPEVKIPENWKSALPKEFQEEPSLKLVTDVPTLVKNYLNAQKMIGADKIVIPSKHATDEDWKTVFQKLGQPADIKDYEVKYDKTLPFDEASIKGFKETAHANGILPKQAEKLLDWYGKSLKDQTGAIESERKAKFEGEWESLRKTWGEAFDNKVGAAMLVVKEFGDPDVVEYMRASGLGSDPKLARFLAKIGETMLEDKLPTVQKRGADGNPALTPEEAKQKVNEIMGNKEHPYFVKTHPGHKAAIEEMQRYFKAQFPEPAKK